MKRRMGIVSLLCWALQAYAQPQTLTESNEALGLYAAKQFQQRQGAQVEDKRIPAPALWYFKQEIIATPKPDM